MATGACKQNTAIGLSTGSKTKQAKRQVSNDISQVATKL